MGYPYLGVIDPRTGECMRIYNQITVDSLTSGLNDMLSTHASPECAPQEPSVSDDWKNSSDSSMKRNLVSDSSISVSIIFKLIWMQIFYYSTFFALINSLLKTNRIYIFFFKYKNLINILIIE